MTAREIQVTFDCADPGALAQFWALALDDVVVQPPPPPFESWLERFEPDGGLSAGYLVLADPEDNELCLD